jgi:hypothetical protein
MKLVIATTEAHHASPPWPPALAVFDTAGVATVGVGPPGLPPALVSVPDPHAVMPKVTATAATSNRDRCLTGFLPPAAPL